MSEFCKETPPSGYWNSPGHRAAVQLTAGRSLPNLAPSLGRYHLAMTLDRRGPRHVLRPAICGTWATARNSSGNKSLWAFAIGQMADRPIRAAARVRTSPNLRVDRPSLKPMRKSGDSLLVQARDSGDSRRGDPFWRPVLYQVELRPFEQPRSSGVLGDLASNRCGPPRPQRPEWVEDRSHAHLHQDERVEQCRPERGREVVQIPSRCAGQQPESSALKALEREEPGERERGHGSRPGVEE